MKKSLTALALLSSSAIASASPLIYEGFDYTPGELLGQQNPSTGNTWLQAGPNPGTTSLADINVVGTGLSVPSQLGATTGGGLTITANENGGFNGACDRLALPSQITSGTVYYSLALRIDSLSGSNQSIGAFFIAFNNTGNSSQTGVPSIEGARLQVRIDPSNSSDYDLGIFNNHGAPAVSSSWSSGMPVDGSTLFVVGSYTFNPSSGDDVSSLWINPASADLGAGSAPTATFTDTTGGSDLVDVGSILLRESAAPYLTIDELRVGTSWADVTSPVPEPASLSLLGLGAGALMTRRRKSR